MSEAQIAPAAAAPPPEAAKVPQAASEGQEPPAGMTAAEKKIWKLKADGQEFEFDASDEEAVKREIMKARGSSKRFEEAAAMRRQAEQFIHLLQTDPKSVLTNPKLGLDFKKIAEEFIWEQMQEERLTPEQKRQREVERELEKYKTEEKKAKEKADEDQRLQLQQHYEADYEKRIMSALEMGGVPKTKGTVRRMAYYLQQSIANNLDLEPSDLVAQVRKDYQEEHREMYSSAEGDTLMSLVGEDLAKKIRETDIKRLKSTQGNQFQTPAPKIQRSGASAERAKRLSGSDWRASLMAEAGFAKKKK